MASSNALQFEMSDSLQKKGFQLIRDGQYIVLEDREGNQASSYIYKKWKTTVKKFEDAIEEKQLINDRLTLEEILFCLTRNRSLLTSIELEETKEVEEEQSQTPQQQQAVELTEDLTREVSFKEIADILSSSIKKDEPAKVITFCGMLLAQTNEDQLNIGFQAESSAGKSYIPMEVASYFRRMKLRLSLLQVLQHFITMVENGMTKRKL